MSDHRAVIDGPVTREFERAIRSTTPYASKNSVARRRRDQALKRDREVERRVAAMHVAPIDDAPRHGIVVDENVARVEVAVHYGEALAPRPRRRRRCRDSRSTYSHFAPGVRLHAALLAGPSPWASCARDRGGLTCRPGRPRRDERLPARFHAARVKSCPVRCRELHIGRARVTRSWRAAFRAAMHNPRMARIAAGRRSNEIRTR